MVVLELAYFTFSSEGRVAAVTGPPGRIQLVYVEHFSGCFTLPLLAPLWPGSTVTVVMGYLMRLTHGKTGSTGWDQRFSFFV